MVKNKTRKRVIITLVIVSILAFAFFKVTSKLGYDFKYTEGEKIDSLNHVIVYYNGNTGNIFGRNITKDNYNLGLKYQCVEFVKRYYYEYLHHKMPNVYGNAIDFYDKNIADGQLNIQRGLLQYTNSSKSKPQINDLIVLDGTSSNPFGHVAIISEVTDDEIEVIQQNVGGKSRDHFDLELKEGKWHINNDRVMGWLRK